LNLIDLDSVLFLEILSKSEADIVTRDVLATAYMCMDVFVFCSLLPTSKISLLSKIDYHCLILQNLR